MRAVAAFLALMTLTLPLPSHAELRGRVSVIDGDSLSMAGRQIRLYGIDAPESVQNCVTGGKRWPCGARAKRALARRVAGRTIGCEPKLRDRHGRIVAVCRLGSEDLGSWLVVNGWALAYRRYSRAYVDQERTARAERRGMWSGDFVAPWEWRRTQRSAARDTASRCRIKGNVGRNGARIYHVPGGRNYKRTRINPSRGERWFCSEAAARAAGWRKARR